MAQKYTLDSKSGGAVILAITDLRRILLIKEPGRKGPLWKMPGETIEVGEPVLNAVVRGAWEEARLRIPFNHAASAVKNKLIAIVKLHERPRTNKFGLTHIQYFYGIIIPTELLSPLGNRQWRDPQGTLICSRIFLLSALNIAGIPVSQRELILELRPPPT